MASSARPSREQQAAEVVAALGGFRVVGAEDLLADGEGLLAAREGALPVPQVGEYDGQVVDAAGGFRVIGAEGFLAHGQGLLAVAPRRGVRELAVYRRQVVQGLGSVRVGRPEHLLENGVRLPKVGNCRPQLAGNGVQQAQVIEALGREKMTGAEYRLPPRQGPLQRPSGRFMVADLHQHHAEVAVGPGGVGVVGAEVALTQLEGPLEVQDRLGAVPGQVRQRAEVADGHGGVGVVGAGPLLPDRQRPQPQPPRLLEPALALPQKSQVVEAPRRFLLVGAQQLLAKEQRPFMADARRLQLAAFLQEQAGVVERVDEQLTPGAIVRLVGRQGPVEIVHGTLHVPQRIEQHPQVVAAQAQLRVPGLEKGLRQVQGLPGEGQGLPIFPVLEEGSDLIE